MDYCVSSAIKVNDFTRSKLPSRDLIFYLCFWRYAQRNQKPRHHVVSGNRAGEFHDLRGVEVLF